MPSIGLMTKVFPLFFWTEKANLPNIQLILARTTMKLDARWAVMWLANSKEKGMWWRLWDQMVLHLPMNATAVLWMR